MVTGRLQGNDGLDASFARGGRVLRSLSCFSPKLSMEGPRGPGLRHLFDRAEHLLPAAFTRRLASAQVDAAAIRRKYSRHPSCQVRARRRAGNGEKLPATRVTSTLIARPAAVIARSAVKQFEGSRDGVFHRMIAYHLDARNLCWKWNPRKCVKYEQINGYSR